MERFLEDDFERYILKKMIILRELFERKTLKKHEKLCRENQW